MEALEWQSSRQVVTIHQLLGGTWKFVGEKSRPGLQRQEGGLLAKGWLEFID